MNAAPRKRTRRSVSELTILGAGAFALEALEIVEAEALNSVVRFVEGVDRSRVGSFIAGIPVVWVDEIGMSSDTVRLLCAVGSPKRRSFIERAADSRCEFVSVRHPGATVSPSAKIGKGCIIGAGVVIGAECQIGDHVIFNRGSLVGHHVTLGDYVTLSPGANIGGNVTVGEQAHIGMSAVILDHLSVGRNSIVGSGAVVTKDVPPGVQVLGIPARITKQLVNEQ